MAHTARSISRRLFDNLLRIRTRWPSLILLALVLLGCAALAVTRPNLLRGALKGAGSPIPPGQSPAAQQIYSGLAVNLTPFGFEPAAATIRAGKSIITVLNVSGSEYVDLVISRKHGERLVAEKIKSEKRRWDKALDLTPGEYVISASNNPGWTCALTAIPRDK